MRTAGGQGDSSLDGRIPSAHNQSVLPRELLRIEKAIVNFIEFFAGNAQLAKVSATANRHNDTLRPDRCLIAGLEKQLIAFSFNPLDPSGNNFDSSRSALF